MPNDELRHLRLVVLPPEPLVSAPVHPLGLLGEGLHHVRAASEPLPDFLRFVQRSVRLVVPTALIGLFTLVLSI